MPTERQVKQHAESKLFVPSSESQDMELWLSGASSKTQQILDAFATLITKVTRATAARILLNASFALTGSIQISDSPGNRGFHLGAHYGARTPAIPIRASQKREYQANSGLAGYPYRVSDNQCLLSTQSAAQDVQMSRRTGMSESGRTLQSRTTDWFQFQLYIALNSGGC